MAFTPRTETYVNLASLTTPFNITVTKPTGTVNGDILFCWIGWYVASGNPPAIDSVPSGWSLLGEMAPYGTWYKFALYYKIASGEGASWVWSFAATAKVRAVCSCYTSGDFNASNPINVVSNTIYTATDAICRAASMNVAAANSPLIFWGGVYATTSKTFTKPSVPTTGWVEDDDAGSTTPDYWTEVCSFIWSGSGATGNMDATVTATITSKHAFAVALNPAGGATTQTKTTTAKARIKSLNVTKTVTTKGRVKQLDIIKTLTAKGKIVSCVTKTSTAKARVKQAGKSETIQVKARSKQIGLTKTIQTKVDIKKTKIIQGIFAGARITTVGGRLWSCGFELNSLTSNVEITGSSGDISIVTSPVRSGTYALRANILSPNDDAWVRYQFSTGTPVTYYRYYMRVAQLPSSTEETCFIQASDTQGLVIVRIDQNGVLQVFNDLLGGQIGSDSSALDLDTWYRIELLIDNTVSASTLVQARLSGIQFASGIVNFSTSTSPYRFYVGFTSPSEQGDIYFDDIAINTNQGSFQNSWPGAGSIVHLRPSGTGDNPDWTGNNTDIDEVTPDDATTKITSNTLGQIEDVNVDNTPVAIGSNDPINVVHVGIRYNGEGASANSGFKLRAKKVSGGTVSVSSEIIPADTTWVTNANATPRNYALTLYEDPDSSPWTKATLDTTQIGAIISTGNTNDAQISTLWALVEYVPTVGGGAVDTKSAVFNEGRFGWKVFDYRLTSKTIQAKASVSIKETKTKTLQAKSRIQQVDLEKTLQAKSRVKKTISVGDVWTVQYEANELPDAATPAWTKVGDATTIEISPAGFLHILADNTEDLEYTLTDSNLVLATGATIETRVKIVQGEAIGGNQIGYLMLSTMDGDAGFEIHTDGIADVYHSGVPLYSFDTTDDYHTYRITLITGSAKVYIDGILRGTLDISGGGISQILWVVTQSGGSTNETSWDYVYYRTDGAFGAGLQAKASIFKTISQTSQAKSLISVGAITKSIQGRGDIKVGSVEKTIQTKSRIKVTALNQTITTKARLKQLLTKISQAKGNIKQLGQSQTIQSKAYISGEALTKIIQAKASVTHLLSQTIQAKSRLKKTIGYEETTTSIFGLAVKGWKIFGSEEWSPTKLWAKAKLVYRSETTIQSKARVKLMSLQTISARSRLFSEQIKTVQAKADLVSLVNKTILAKAGIKKFYNFFLTAKAYIVKFAEGAIVSAAETIEGIVTTKGATEGLAFARSVDVGIVGTRQREGIVQARDYRRGILRADKLNR